MNDSGEKGYRLTERILFNFLALIPEIFSESITILASWLNKSKASLKEIQYILGNLNYVAACFHRIYIFRKLKWLKVLYKKDSSLNVIPNCAKKHSLVAYLLPTL